MLDFEHSNAERLLIIRPEGMQSTANFGTTAIRMIENRTVAQPKVRILFDWTAIKKWANDDSLAGSRKKWQPVAMSIERSAIVHDHRWDRQAAVLAAILRMNGCVVRSWIPSDIEGALAWLKNNSATAQPSTVERPVTLTPSCPASVPGIHAFPTASRGVDGRHKAGHDEEKDSS